MPCVYALSSSLDPGVVRYIGRSSKDDGKQRHERHLQEARLGNNSYKYRWARSVQSAGGEIVFTILESGITWVESAAREIFYIAHYRNLGFALTNLTEGGDGAIGYVFTPEDCAKISAATKGRPKSAEQLAKLLAGSMARTDKSHSDETKAKIGAGNRGKIQPPCTPEHRAKLSAALKGKRKGIPFTAEHRANMSIAARARPAKTHCKWGHEFTEENTGRNGGKRVCRTCDNARHRNDYNNNNTNTPTKGDK